MIMKNIYLLGTLFCALFLSSCQSSDDVTVSQEVGPFTIDFFDTTDGNILSSNFDLLNGEQIRFDIKDGQGSTASLESFEIKNVSNNNVSVSTIYSDHLSFKTDQLTDQEFSFDVFYKGKSIKTVNSKVKVLYKLIKDGSELPEAFVLNFDQQSIPEEFKIVNIDDTEIENYDHRSVSFSGPENVYLENYTIYNGRSFKVIFNKTEAFGSEFVASLFYRSEASGYKDVFIKDINVKTNYLIENGSCQVVSRTQTNTNIARPDLVSIDGIEFYIENGNLVATKSLNYQLAKKDILFYNQNKLTEIYATGQDSPVKQYEYYNNGLIKRSVSLGKDNPNLVISDNNFYYDTDNNLIGTSSYTINDQNNLIITDSTANSGFMNDQPSRIVRYDYDTSNNTPEVRYYKAEYDPNGNIVREEISTNDIDYIVSYEATYDPTEKVIEYLVYETGETMVEKSLLLSQTTFVNYRGDVISPAFRTLKELKKDNDGNILSVDYLYSQATDGDFSFVTSYEYRTDNCN